MPHMEFVKINKAVFFFTEMFHFREQKTHPYHIDGMEHPDPQFTAALLRESHDHDIKAEMTVSDPLSTVSRHIKGRDQNIYCMLLLTENV